MAIEEDGVPIFLDSEETNDKVTLPANQFTYDAVQDTYCYNESFSTPGEACREAQNRFGLRENQFYVFFAGLKVYRLHVKSEHAKLASLPAKNYDREKVIKKMRRIEPIATPPRSDELPPKTQSLMKFKVDPSGLAGTGLSLIGVVNSIQVLPREVARLMQESGNSELEFRFVERPDGKCEIYVGKITAETIRRTRLARRAPGKSLTLSTPLPGPSRSTFFIHGRHGRGR